MDKSELSTDTIYILSNFLDEAEKRRNYPSNTAAGVRSALRLFGRELNEVESSSPVAFIDNVDKIYRQVAANNKNRMSPDSLETYYRRLKNLISDFEECGGDVDKMAVKKRAAVKKLPSAAGGSRPVSGRSLKAEADAPAAAAETEVSAPDSNRLELSLRPGVKAIVILPADLTSDEAGVIKALVDASVR